MQGNKEVTITMQLSTLQTAYGAVTLTIEILAQVNITDFGQEVKVYSILLASVVCQKYSSLMQKSSFVCFSFWIA